MYHKIRHTVSTKNRHCKVKHAMLAPPVEFHKTIRYTSITVFVKTTIVHLLNSICITYHFIAADFFQCIVWLWSATQSIWWTSVELFPATDVLPVVVQQSFAAPVVGTEFWNDTLK